MTHSINNRLLFAALIVTVLLGGCRARFPTDKFVRAEDQRNWHLLFFNDGRWEGYYDGNLITFGSYRADSRQITFESDHLCEKNGAPEPVTYNWSYEEETLTFIPAGDDLCAARREMLTGGAYKKST
ncbi:MAG: hypothetical protein QME21_19085 [Anaerolineales bacterium]|nr:hypothetical protein [Anaerolineales bacterium]